MKRFFLSSIALVMAVTACTESGLIDAPEFYGKSIVFDTYIGKAPMTKAESIEISNLENSVTGARMYAFKADKGKANKDNVDYSSAYLDGRLVKSSGIWNYQTYKNNAWGNEDAYMPSEKDLAFIAYNSDALGCMSYDVTDVTNFDFTVKDNMADQVDLLVTPFTFVTETGETTTVPLRFYHLLSRIGFKLMTTGGNTQVTIHTLKLHGRFVKSGHVNMTLATATPNTNPESDESINITRVPSIYPNKEGSNAYVNYYDFLGTGNSFQINSGSESTTQQIYINSNEPSNDKNCYLMLIPGQVENLIDADDIDKDGNTTEYTITPYIEVKYQLGSSDPKTAKVSLEQTVGNVTQNWNFEAGKAYEFVFKITTAAIEFSGVVVNKWDGPEYYPEDDNSASGENTTPQE